MVRIKCLMKGAANGLAACEEGVIPVVLTREEMSRWPCGVVTVWERVRRDSRLAGGRESVGERRTERA